MNVLAVGGSGAGGSGAVVQSDIEVTPGETLYVEVGGNGYRTGGGGWNGGGSAGNSGAGGGGGASDVRTTACDADCPTGTNIDGFFFSLGSRLIVAGGGGGDGKSTQLCDPDFSRCFRLLGGSGGGATEDGLQAANGGAEGGQAGTENHGGSVGAPGGCAGPAQAGSGGPGVGESAPSGGGGGGGGYFGGGAGYGDPGCATGGGGGGGSDYPLGAALGLDTTATPQVTLAVPVPNVGAPPTIAGTPAQGQTLTELHGIWAEGPITGYLYQWSRCDGSGASCVPIPGASRATYTLAAGDVGSTIKVTEIASNSYGKSAPAWSDATARVRSGIPVNVAAPTLVGSPVAGQVLAVQRGLWSNGPTSFRYQWFRCNAGGNCQPVAGQTGLSYVLTRRDIKSTIRIQEVAVNAWGPSLPAISASTPQVSDAALTLQAFALVGTARGIVPGPVASFSQSEEPRGAADSYAATVSWGDRSNSRGTVVAGRSGSYLVDASHAYRRAGNYTVTVRVNAPGGAWAQSANRVSVFAATVCPKASGPKGRNCLGDISLPAGCVLAGDRLRVAIPLSGQIESVRYTIDSGPRSLSGSGRRFAAALPTLGLASGTHRLTARITFRSGQPRTLSKARRFAVC